MVLIPEHEELPLWIGPADDAKPFFSMANGLLDPEALLARSGNELRDHSPKWFSPIAYPYNYEPNATCPNWMALLERTLEGDDERISLLQEWFGYCLTPDLSQQKFMILEGEGANGKSVVCEVLTHLLGKDNVSNVPLEIFGDRFQATMTLGKLANIVSEIGEINRLAEGQLKAFTSGDKMYFDRKGIDGVEAYPTARLLFATNQRPRFTDRSAGIWRRLILIPFRVVIPENEQDRNLIEKLKAESPGIFLWAAEGLRRLRLNGHFTESAVCRAELDEYRSESNPTREYLADNYDFDVSASIKAAVAYASLGASQSEMAQQLGVAVNTVARWERGDLVPPKIAELAAECLLFRKRSKIHKFK